MTQKQQISFLKGKLASDAQWAVRGMLRIFENQTADEQSSEATLKHNGIGFNGTDANILSSFSKQVKRGRSLSERQMVYVFRKMPKYAGQLRRVSDTDKLRSAMGEVALVAPVEVVCEDNDCNALAMPCEPSCDGTYPPRLCCDCERALETSYFIENQ